MCLIFLCAGAFSGAVTAAGGVDSTVNLGLSLIPPHFAVAGLFIIGCFISVSMGTSVGTITALAPIAVGISKQTGFSMAICVAAVVCGAMFGDNLSMISDTTIAAVKTQGCEMKDKFKMNFFIALPAAIVAMILYSVVGGTGSGAIKAGSYNIIEVLPYLIVLGAALMGINVAVVLFVGILSAGIIGLCVGSCGFFDWIQAIGNGMSDMFSISMVAILVSGIIGIVREYGGVEWLVGAISGKIKNRRGAEYGIGLMSGILSAAMVNNTIAIIVTCPIAKEIGEKYKIAPKRLASLVDIFACAFISLMPHDGGMLMITALADVSPLNVLKYSFYMFGLIIALISGALMSIQGVFNTEVTKQSSTWTTSTFVQATGFLACLLIWLIAEREQSFTMLLKVSPRYLLLGGVIGAAITFTVIKSVASLGPAQSAMLIVASQSVVSYLIEVFGLFGVEKTGFAWVKLLGVVLFVTGLIIFKWKS